MVDRFDRMGGRSVRSGECCRSVSSGECCRSVRSGGDRSAQIGWRRGDRSAQLEQNGQDVRGGLSDQQGVDDVSHEYQTRLDRMSPSRSAGGRPTIFLRWADVR